MDGAQFAGHCNALRAELVNDFTHRASGSEVAAKIAALGLDDQQALQLTAILDTVVRDTMYTLLLATAQAGSAVQRQQQRVDGVAHHGVKDGCQLPRLRMIQPQRVDPGGHCAA